MYLNQADALRYSASYDNSAATSHLMWPSADVAAAVDPVFAAGIKRSSEALYHQTLFGTHNTLGQSEAWYSTDSLLKRPRLESTSHLPIYPQRPGEKDCAHYMLTRTCKFGDTCKFDHPIWVPEGGIPDWKEVPPIPATETLPERPGEPDCPYFIKTQRCKFAMRCKFNHPKEKLVSLETSDISALPERPSEPPCTFYMKTGKCKFGITCKFHHPKDVQIPLAVQENGNIGHSESATMTEGITGDAKPGVSFTAALLHNTKGLPIRPMIRSRDILLAAVADLPDFHTAVPSSDFEALKGELEAEKKKLESEKEKSRNLARQLEESEERQRASMDVEAHLTTRLSTTSCMLKQEQAERAKGEVDCPFYLKTGSCKYGATCRYNHPDRIGHHLIASPSATLNLGFVHPAASVYQTIEPRLAQQTMGVGATIYPQRPGQIECDFYMKTGECRFGERCRFHHPLDRSTPTLTQTLFQNVKLTLAGLPRREGAVICPYYLKTSTCKYGATCKFDHPPPAEVMAMAASQGTATSEADGDQKGG